MTFLITNMDTYLKTNYVLQYGCWCLQSYGKTDMQLNPHEIFKEISIFFSLVIAHSFIVHMGILHPLQIGKELLYTQDSGQSNPANISVLIGFFFFFFFKKSRYTPLASCKGEERKQELFILLER